MARLSMYLLGPFQVTLDGEPVTSFKYDHVRALLVYLAVEADRPHRRERLAGLLWPEQPDSLALSNLRYALYHLRQAIGDHEAMSPFLLITRETLQFNTASDHWLDVDDFRFSIADFRFSVADQESQIENLKLAIGLYRGEFLEGLALGDSPAFEEWVLLEREQFLRQALTALQRLAALHELGGEYEQAAAHTRQLLALEPWDEAAHRRLMRLLALGGQRSAALAQYEICCRLLACELGVEPEDETTVLYERIRDGLLSRGAEEPGSRGAILTPAPLLPSTPALFVAREQELAQLDQFLGLALAGQGRVVFVTGEAGSGKTALLTEFARRTMAVHGDLLFAAGRGAAQAGVGDPYLPFREILAMLAGDVEAGWTGGIHGAAPAQRLGAALPAVVEALVGAGPALLDTFVPGETLALRAESLAPGGAAWRSRLEALLARRRGQAAPLGRQGDLFEQVSRVLQAVARRHPLLLVLDDLQWADPGSISLLFHLGRRLGGGRILVAGAYRPADVALGRKDQRHPLQPVVHEFQRDWGEIVVDLDRADGRSFVDAYLDSEPNHLDDEFRARLHRTTEGHALFITELLRSLQDRGHLTRDAEGHWAAGSGLDWQTMPARVEAVIAERLSSLPAEWRAVLDVASVEGEEFEAELVARVLGADERAVLRALGGPLSKQQRLVQPAGLHQAVDGQRLSRYRFRHALFQRYLYQELDEAERTSLHEAVGTQLEALHEGQVADLAPQLAWHFEAAGAMDKAADYCLKAGHHAYRLSAHEEAIAHYQRGLALLEGLPEPADPALRLARIRRELALHLGLGPPLQARRGWANPAQVRTYERAYELAHELAGQVEMSPEFLQVFYMQPGVAAGQGAYRQALHLSQQLLALAQQSGDPLALGLAHFALGASHFVRGACVPAREHLEAALALYRSQPSRFPVFTGTDMGVNCLSWLSLALCTLGYPAQALVRSREALALARDLALPPSLGLALTVAVCTLHFYCRQVEAVRECATEQLLALAREKDLVLFREWVEIALGWCQVEAGEFEAGISRMRQGASAWQQMGTVPGQFLHLALLAEACCKAGQVSQGLDCIDEALALVRRVGCSNHEPEIHRIRGELLRSRDEPEAEKCFWRAIEVARQKEARWWELRATMSLARLLSQQGRVEEAHRMLADIYGWFSEGFDTPDLQAAKALLEELS
jgi:DNA-binding SARP family transcriptional activator/tetratricopeptide (TPR) repeat protein